MSGIKKAVKSVGRFVKKHWKKIVIAAAVVFTAGLATVGTAGFSSAMSSGGFLSAAGKTMVAGVQAIGGTMGIGNGANLAAFGGKGTATLLNGAAAQSVGIAGTNAAQTAGNIAKQKAASNAAAAGISTATQAGKSTATKVIGSAPKASGVTAAGTNAAGGGGTAALVGGGAGAAPSAAPAASSFWSSPAAGALLQGGASAAMALLAQKQEEDSEETPLAYFGREARDGGGGLSADQVRFTGPAQDANSWRPRLMYDSPNGG
jgi:hypothetical protein